MYKSKAIQCAFVILLSLIPLFALGQTNRGRISGQVTDSSGAVIPGAKITIENSGTHVQRVLDTNAEGSYTAPDLDPGIYSLKAEAENFKALVRAHIQLEVANDLKIDFRLQPGLVTEVVEVSELAPLTNTSDAVLSGALSNEAITELPMQGRDFQNLLPLHPGVQREPGGGFHTLVSNGMRPDDNNFIIDGATDNDAYYGETVVNDAGISGTPASHLPLDAIQEFNTEEQPSADFGAKPGVVVNMGLKSGTDTVHGSVYYFYRNSAFDARNYFNPTPEPVSALLLNQFGASLGGAFIKKKWFYFANYEGVRDKVGNPYGADSPVTTSLVGRVDPSTLSYPLEEYSIVDALNVTGCGQSPLPANCSQLSHNLLKYFLPNPGLTLTASDPALINFDFNNTNREDNIVFKSDYRLSDHHTFSGRYIYSNSNQVEEDAVPIRPEWLSKTKPITQVFGVDWVYTPNSRWVNTARFSFNTFNEAITPVDGSVNPTTYGLNTGVTNPQLFGFPRINPDQNTMNYMGGNSSWPLATTPSRTMTLSDTATYLVGKHSLRFGYSYSLGDVQYFRANYGRGRIDFDTLSDFLEGNVASWRILYGDPSRDIRMTSNGLFAQDDYRITRRVTLNLGLRYDITLPIKDTQNRLGNYDPTKGLVQVGYGISQLYPTRYNNVSPRLGVAWDAFGNGKTVVRSAFGMIYIQPSIRTFVNSAGLNLVPTGLQTQLDYTNGNVVVQAPTGTITSFVYQSNDPTQINWTPAGPIFPINNPNPPICSIASPCTISAVDPNLKTPYVLNWNLNVQQQITPSSVLQVAYVANHGVKLYSTIDQNQIDPAIAGADSQYGRPLVANCPVDLGGLGTGGSCFPYLQFVNTLGNKSLSSYQSLQVTFTKRYSKGLYLLAGYTYGHAIDTTSGTTNLSDVPQNSLDYAAEKASGDYDIRHRFTLSAVYDLPSKKSPLQALEGWQLSGIYSYQTGEPLNLYDSYYDLTGTLEGYDNNGWDRWNIVGSPKNLKWNQTSGIPFLSNTTDNQGNTVLNASCAAAAQNSPALLASLAYVGGCWGENGSFLIPNAQNTFGDMGRNILRGPGFNNLDFSVSKIWKLHERLQLQFRGEFFNILNHPNFANGSVSTDLSGSTLGLAKATPDVQASNPVIGSGGSRHIQLGLKVLW